MAGPSPPGASESDGSVRWPPRRTPRASGSPPSPREDPKGLSLVIPAYREENRIGPTLGEYLPVLEELRVPYEVVVVSSGPDRTPEVAGAFAPRGVRVVHSVARMGKGRAILEGFRQARYAIVGYADADASVPGPDMRRLLQRALEGERVVVASRRLEPGKVFVRSPAPKYWASNLWHGVVRALLDLPLRDAECGFKVLTKELAERVSREVRVTNWVFDVTMLYHLRASGEAILEVPVSYRYHHDSRFRLVKVAPVMMLGLVCVFLVNRSGLRPVLPMRFLRAMNQRFAAE